MSSGCGDVLSLADLQTAKKHQLFEAEVITGKQGGDAGGVDIDYATNQVTGQVQKTMPAILRDIGFTPVSWDFSTGGTLTVNDRDKVVYDPVSKTWYSYAGALPVTVPAGFNPVGNADWKPQTDPSLKANLGSSDGFKMIGQCPSVSALRGIEPTYDGQKILVTAHTAGYEYGGGEFYAVVGGASYTDNNGTVIKTTGGAVWLRKQKHYTYVVDFGFITDDDTKAASNTAAIQTAAAWAYANGSDVWLPMGEKHINATTLSVPVTIKGNTTIFGASLVERTQKSDVVHHGGGFAFDFTPMIRPTVPASPQPVSDGPALIGLSIRGNNTDAAGGWRVNTSAVVGNETYARRNFTAMNVQVSGYLAGYGFQMFWMFTNKLHNVVVWDCAVAWYMRSCYANDHFGGVYENCSYGVLAINCFANNHFGGAIEGIRSQVRHTKPSDYDENGNSPLTYDGIGVRCRGGNFYATGTYFEANRIHYQIENAGKVNIYNCYENNISTERIAHGISGEFRQTNCIIAENPTVGTWVQASGTLMCSYAEIHSNNYINMTKPSTVPNISTVGEFDVYDGTIANTNACRRVRLGQDTQTGGFQANSSSPRETYSEIFANRVSNAGSSSVTRTIDIGTLATLSGHITALQSGGALTFTNSNTAFAKEGRDLFFVINAGGGCTAAFGSGFRLAIGSAISLSNGQTATLHFKSQGNMFYQIGQTNILST